VGRVVLDAAWVVYLAALGVLAVYGAHRVWLTIGALRARRGARVADAGAPRFADAALPIVTIQLPLYDEPAVVARVIDAACAVDYPRDRLEVQVLDDSRDAAAIALAAERVAHWRAAGVDVVHVRRDDRRGFKAGALEAGRRVARGEVFAILDADFVAPADLLRRHVHHFADPAVGMVQLRWDHLNRASTALTEVEALLLDGHFAIEQRARAGRGCVFNFNGTAGLWRAAAIADAGGWDADTLTEDLDLSYRAALRGWRFVLDTTRGVPGELPARMPAFRGQQFRWAKGSVEVARKLGGAIARAPWGRGRRLEALLHVTHNVPYLATAVLVATSAITLGLGGGPAWAGGLQLAMMALTALVLGGYVVASQRLLGRGSLARAVVRVPGLVALTAGISFGQARAVVEGAIGRRSAFVRTPKDGAVGAARVRAARRRTRGLVELALACALALAAVVAMERNAWVEASHLTLFAIGSAWVGIASEFDL
jgi:hypothetical protein